MKLFDNQQKLKSHLIDCDKKVQIINKTKQSGADNEWVGPS